MSAWPRLWVLASGNPGKLHEFAALLGDTGLEIRPQSDFGISPAPETGSSFVENALAKARHASALAGLPAIADDSGLCVDALAGAPGILSARFAHAGASDADNTAYLLEKLADVPTPARGAHFYCVIVALLASTDPAPIISTGRWDGRIAEQSAGLGGFGYDPVFIAAGASGTVAEMPNGEKHRVSHRARALAGLHRCMTGQDRVGVAH